MKSARKISLLRALARTYSILPSFEDNDGNICWAKPETLAALINALEGKNLIDAEKPSEKKIRKLLSDTRRQRLEHCFPESLVAWNGKIKLKGIWLPENIGGQPLELILKSNREGEIRKSWEPDQYQTYCRDFGDLGTYCKADLQWRKKIPYGYYHLELRSNNQTIGRSFLISAPEKVTMHEPCWGAFGPAYAMRSRSDWGIGSFRELGQVCKFIKSRGGQFVGTLPMLAGFMEGERSNPSPYSPVSRLFWNEIFLDIDSLPGVPRTQLDEQDKTELERLREEELIDYEKVYALKKKYLLKASERFFVTGGDDRDDFEIFLSEYPLASDYANFRSKEYPEHERQVMRRYHLYAQFAIHRQLLDLGEKAASGEAAEIYLDYPVGVHNDGFDASHMKHLFIPGFNVGAPPDEFSDYGQDWGFMPLHPARLSNDDFNYFRDSVHNYFRYARIIRLDHIMGFYRIFCVPHGDKPANGCYIKYPFETFLAVLNLETWRHDGVLIGEDLGTVPPQVRKAMNKHGILRTWLFQFYLKKDPEKTFRSIPKMCLAALNTHDMAPFKSFWESEDVKRLEDVGALEPENARQILKERSDVLKGWKDKKNPFIFVMENMALSSAQFLLVNLEDLWGETQPQNLPGTTDQYPNWRKKFRQSIEVWMKDMNVNNILKTIDNSRRARK